MKQYPPNSVIVACEMLEDELRFAMEQCGCTLPVIWLERGLHETPNRLREKLQEIIDELDEQGCPLIIMAMMICGSAIDHIGAQHAEIVFPLYHDCIDMQIEEVRDVQTFYLTRGWLQGDIALQNVYQSAVERYGEKKALRFFRMMLKNYTSVTMIDTGAYPLQEHLQIPQMICDLAGLQLRTCKGSTKVLQALVSGEWDDRFCHIMPGERYRVITTLLE